MSNFILDLRQVTWAFLVLCFPHDHILRFSYSLSLCFDGRLIIFHILCPVTLLEILLRTFQHVSSSEFSYLLWENSKGLGDIQILSEMSSVNRVFLSWNFTCTCDQQLDLSKDNCTNKWNRCRIQSLDQWQTNFSFHFAQKH